MTSQTVILGPTIDLHPGFHGSLSQDAPQQVSYHQRGGRHHFLLGPQNLEPTARSLFENPHFAELVDFGPGPQVAHSARWPVVGRRAWIADMDDFGYPFLLGRYAIRACLDSEHGEPWSKGLAAAARRRLAIMLGAFTHPSCKAVLFWTRHALDDAERWLRRLDLAESGQAFLDKCRVLYPAQRPTLLPAGVEAKWSGDTPLEVLFVGNDFDAKNGRLALRIFQRLRTRHPGARFTYVGHVPQAELGRTEGVTHHADLPRSEVMALFRASHIFFHPARAESFGMALLEAAASGLAILAARGAGLPHMDELFNPRQALLVDRDSMAPDAEEIAFETHLDALLRSRPTAHAFALASYEVATVGELSLAARNSALGDLYRRAQSEPASEPFLDLRSRSSRSSPRSIR